MRRFPASSWSFARTRRRTAQEPPAFSSPSIVSLVFGRLADGGQLERDMHPIQREFQSMGLVERMVMVL